MMLVLAIVSVSFCHIVPREYYRAFNLSTHVSSKTLQKTFRQKLANTKKQHYLTTAYTALTSHREQYDLYGPAFMNYQQKPKTKFQTVRLLVSDQQIFKRGANITVTGVLYRGCPACQGTGALSESKRTVCKHCGGRKLVEKPEYQLCPKCRGTGQMALANCEKCKGMGIMLTEEKIMVEVERGSKSPAQIQVRNCGNEDGLEAEITVTKFVIQLQ